MDLPLHGFFSIAFDCEAADLAKRGRGAVSIRFILWDYILLMKPPQLNNETTSDRLTTVLSYGAILLLGYLVFLITGPFLVPLAWSGIFAIFFYPLHDKIRARFKPNVAAMLSTLAVTFFLIVPAVLVLYFTTKQAIDATARIQSSLANSDQTIHAHAVEWIRSKLPETWQTDDVTKSLQQAAEKIASFVAGKFGAILKNLVQFFVDLFLLIFSLFFMFRDGKGIARATRHLLPFDTGIQDEMWKESKELVFASVAVGLVVAMVQGALGGVAFAVAGIPTPIFWAAIIAFFSLVPVVGSALIWAPASLWLLVSGHWGKALIVVGICGGIAGIADNIIRPLLLRNRTQLNDLLLFISVLGGLEAFGLLGLVIGPTIMAAAMGIFRVYMEHREHIAAHRPPRVT